MEVTPETTSLDLDETASAVKYDRTVIVSMPKFSKGYKSSDILAFLLTHVNQKDIMGITAMPFPNEWNVSFNSKEAREKLLQVRHGKVSNKKCTVRPYSDREARGRIQWVPAEFDDKFLKEILEVYGDIVQFKSVPKENINNEKFNHVYVFTIFLKENYKREDIPHFLFSHKHVFSINIFDRKPVCYGCKKIGHKKSECTQNAFKMIGKKLKRNNDPKMKKFKPFFVKNNLPPFKNINDEGDAAGPSNPIPRPDQETLQLIHEFRRSLNVRGPKTKKKERTVAVNTPTVATAVEQNTQSTEVSKKKKKKKKKNASASCDLPLAEVNGSSSSTSDPAVAATTVSEPTVIKEEKLLSEAVVQNSEDSVSKKKKKKKKKSKGKN